MAELTPNLPIAAAMIKTLHGGTSATIRKAHAPDVSSIVSKMFINLHTNVIPFFDQSMDYGT